MDAWIRLRASEMTNAVAARLDAYDPPAAVGAIEAFVEDLSNWYVRRSRRRFWDGDPEAHRCLHEVLVILTKVLAPFLPFTSEALYQNLVRGVDRDAPPSVHLTGWPSVADPTPGERRLLADMRVVTRLAALGHAARAASDVKLRQPLAKAMVAVPDDAAADALTRLAATLAEELNVKTVELVREEGSLVSYTVRPVLPKLGPRLGPLMPAVRAALSSIDPSSVAATVQRGEALVLDVAGERVELAADEVEVLAAAREGLATAEDGGFVVGLELELTYELRAEGVARDLIRAVNQLRKDAGFDISDRIRLDVDATGNTARVVEDWRPVISTETLATRLEIGAPDNAAAVGEARIEGGAVRIGVTRL
jgi:isoleucyl-tRNA synthetase